MSNKPTDPLPGELLPPSRIDEDQTDVDRRMQNLLAAASPILVEYRNQPASWLSMIANRLRPQLALGVAAAAALTIAVHLALPAPTTAVEPSLPLATVAGERDEATALWSIVNDDIDPVLALVILEGESP